MKAAEIITQLQVVLPRVTDLFSDVSTITSLTRSGTTVTAITSTVHGLTTGDGVTITGAESPLTISSLTFLDGIATATTATAHDLTEGWENGKPSDSSNVNISGATEPEYNGENPLLTVPNRYKFTYTVTGTPASPATGTPLLLQNLSTGYNGRHVVTVVNTTTFTYEITQTPNSPAQGTIQAHTRVRVSGGVSIDRAREAYTSTSLNKLWAFVVLGDTSVSKNRHVESDSTDTSSAGTATRHRLLTPFGVFVFVPATSEIAAMNARDQMEDVRVFLYRSLLRVKFSSSLDTPAQYGVVPESDSSESYNNAVYIHQFVFSTQSDVTYGDTVDPAYNVAFRNVELQYLDDLDTVELTANVNLDEEP